MAWPLPTSFDEMSDALVYMDTVTNGFGSIVMILTIWVIFFVYMMRFGPKQAFAGSTFIIFMISMIMQVLGLLGISFIAVVVGCLIVAMVVLLLT